MPKIMVKKNSVCKKKKIANHYILRVCCAYLLQYYILKKKLSRMNVLKKIQMLSNTTTTVSF